VPVKITLVKGADLAPGAFLQRGQYNHSDITAVKKAAKLAANNHVRLHTLSISGIDHGFVTVGIHQPKNLQIIFK
jgi:hypothetical protein